MIYVRMHVVESESLLVHCDKIKSRQKYLDHDKYPIVNSNLLDFLPDKYRVITHLLAVK